MHVRQPPGEANQNQSREHKNRFFGIHELLIEAIEVRFVAAKALTRCWQTSSECFDGATASPERSEATNQRGFDIIEDSPFMLRISKHSYFFSRNLLTLFGPHLGKETAVFHLG
jgi:hypothetical protein